MIWSLSPAQFFWDWVLVLSSALLLLLEQVFQSVLVSATRFRSLFELKVAVPFLFHPVAKILTQRRELGSLLAGPSCSLIFRPRDLPYRSTKPGFPHLARFALLNSSQLVLRSGRRAPARLG